MREFSKWDQEVLRHLSQIRPGTTMRADEFFNSFYFKQEIGRALILQAQTRYAVFFLKAEVFDLEEKKNAELTYFLDLLSLLKYLTANGHIAFQHAFKGKEKSMYFLQDSFIKPQPSNGPIVLNATGDYTASPDTIHNKNKHVICKGVVFEYETYELIEATMTGTLIISQSLHELMKPTVAHAPKKQAELWVSVSLLLFILIAFVLFSVDSHIIGKLHSQQMSNLLKSHKSIQDKLNKLGQSLKQGDSTRMANQDQNDKDGSSTSGHGGVKKIHYGIDVSKWNGDIKKDLASVDSLSFVICKATEGVTLIDQNFHTNWGLLKSRNLVKGAYHFYYVDDDPIRQADFFWSIAHRLEPGDLMPIVDIEQASIRSASLVDLVKIQVNLLLFLKHLEVKAGRVPMIYTGEAFANKYLTNDSFGKYPLWLAEYNGKDFPIIPSTWKDKGFKIWQKTGSYTVNSHALDFDVFFGDIRELIK